jgi:hypothetical protein
MNARRIPLLLDVDNHITGEYERVLPVGGLGRRYFEHVMKLGNFTKGSGRPLRSCARCLDEIAFDPSDRPYLGVAQRFGGIYITHEEKHLTGEAFLRVPECCGVHVCDLISARQRLIGDEP